MNVRDLRRMFDPDKHYPTLKVALDEVRSKSITIINYFLCKNEGDDGLFIILLEFDNKHYAIHLCEQPTGGWMFVEISRARIK